MKLSPDDSEDVAFTFTEANNAHAKELNRLATSALTLPWWQWLRRWKINRRVRAELPVVKERIRQTREWRYVHARRTGTRFRL